MEVIVKDIERFWSEALRNLKEVLEKGAYGVADRPGRELGLPLHGAPCLNDKENPGRVNQINTFSNKPKNEDKIFRAFYC